MNNSIESTTYQEVPTESLTNYIQYALHQLGMGAEGTDWTRHLAHRSGKGTTHLVRYTLYGLDQVVHGDRITPQILVFNSHRGECAIRIHVGFIRWACSNGMVAGDLCYSDRIIHRVGPTIEQKLWDLPDRIYSAVEYIRSGQFSEDVTGLTTTELTEDQMISVVGNMPISKRSKDRLVNLIVLDGARRQEDSSNTVWSLWNIINEVTRVASRSELANAEKNVNLLEQVVALSNAA